MILDPMNIHILQDTGTTKEINQESDKYLIYLILCLQIQIDQKVNFE